MCDAKGKPLGSLSSTVFTPLSGTESVAVSNTYPAGHYTSALASPPPYNSASLLVVPSIGGDPFGGPVNAIANNGIDLSYGPINGTVTVDLSGQLVGYVTLVWSAPFLPAVYPDKAKSITLLLKTQVSASASIMSTTGAAGPGLDIVSAKATASYGDPYNEMASADGSNLFVGPRSVVGYHLVTVALDSSTGIGKVYLNGKTHWEAVNKRPWGYVWSPPQAPGAVSVMTNGPITATASGSVRAWIAPDSRTVAITSPEIEPSSQFGPLNTATNTYPQNVRTPDGSIVTDVAVSPPLTQPGGGTSWTASPGLIGQAGNFVSPVFAWSLTGPGSLSAF